MGSPHDFFFFFSLKREETKTVRLAFHRSRFGRCRWFFGASARLFFFFFLKMLRPLFDTIFFPPVSTSKFFQAETLPLPSLFFPPLGKEEIVRQLLPFPPQWNGERRGAEVPAPPFDDRPPPFWPPPISTPPPLFLSWPRGKRAAVHSSKALSVFPFLAKDYFFPFSSRSQPNSPKRWVVGFIFLSTTQ